MSSTRTTWRAKPCGWRDRERVVALGEQFGPSGPLVLDVLEELAKEQRSAGHVRTGLRSLSRAAFLPRGAEGIDQARAVLAFAAAVGALDELHIDGDVEMTVTCRVSGFEKDQVGGYEAVRKSQQRAVAAAERDDVPATPAKPDTVPASPETRDNTPACPDSRDTVPVCPSTGEERKEGEREGARDRVAEEQLHPLLSSILDRFYPLEGYMTDAGGVVGALQANSWATDAELNDIVDHVVLWCSDPVDPPRSPSTAGLLRQELQKRSRARVSPAPALRAVSGGRASAPDRVAEMRRAAAAEREREQAGA